MKLRERFQVAGLEESVAQQAMICVMEWATEMASTANRSRRPEASTLVEALEREELPVSPPKGDQLTYDDLAAFVEEKAGKRHKPPRNSPILF